jgi:tripartite-type tricarboxylate transporter receptor subunit TctC
MAMFASMAGIKMTHVPYKGSGQATTDRREKIPALHVRLSAF